MAQPEALDGVDDGASTTIMRAHRFLGVSFPINQVFNAQLERKRR